MREIIQITLLFVGIIMVVKSRKSKNVKQIRIIGLALIICTLVRGIPSAINGFKVGFEAGFNLWKQ